MNIPTFVQQVIYTLVRSAVLFLVGWVAAHGGPKFADGEVAKFTAEAAPVVAMLTWSIWEKFRSRQKQLTAQASGTPISENHLDMLIASGQAPSVLTPRHEAPSLQMKV